MRCALLLNSLNAACFSLFISCLLLLQACGDRVELPRPRAYPRVVYPEKAYKPFDATYCNFTFDQPVYAQIERDTDFFGERPNSDCWFNIQVPQINASIYCSYYPVKSRADFDELVADAVDLTNKHNVKADYIEELPVRRPLDRVYGMVFNVEGPVASSYQFFLTDSTRHFLRGALYFNTQARPDSLAPVAAFMRADLDRMVKTLRWTQ
jgi:gliding motility-associated lipoprotein GldD